MLELWLATDHFVSTLSLKVRHVRCIKLLIVPLALKLLKIKFFRFPNLANSFSMTCILQYDYHITSCVKQLSRFSFLYEKVHFNLEKLHEKFFIFSWCLRFELLCHWYWWSVSIFMLNHHWYNRKSKQCPLDVLFCLKLKTTLQGYNSGIKNV